MALKQEHWNVQPSKSALAEWVLLREKSCCTWTPRMLSFRDAAGLLPIHRQCVGHALPSQAQDKLENGSEPILSSSGLRSALRNLPSTVTQWTAKDL